MTTDELFIKEQFPQLKGMISQECECADGEKVVLFSKKPFSPDDLKIFKQIKRADLVALLREDGFVGHDLKEGRC